MKRSRIKPVSKKKRLQQNDERSIRRGYLEAHPYCQGHDDGAPGDCYGALHIHEPWTRARGGPTDDPRNMRTCCDFLNTQISQSYDTMVWAKENGYLVSSHEGPRYLEEHPHDCGNPVCLFVEVVDD